MSYDITIIGAGITGAGVAQAAAAAGYKVAVLESSQVGGATSSNSSKLIHGGLRYLESLQFSLVRESLQERETLLRIAPELVKLAPLHIPIYKNSKRNPLTIHTGLFLYRLLSGWDATTQFRRLNKNQWPELDAIRHENLIAIYRYFEAQTDDRALTRAVMASAQQLGAELLQPAEFTGAALRASAQTSTVQAAGDIEVNFYQGGRVQHLSTRVLVNCAGPWASELNKKITPTPALPPVELVQGSHLLLPPVLQHHYYLESPSDGRAVFALPWQGKLLLGTTETPHQDAPEQAVCHPHETHYLLNILKHYFPDLHLLPSSAQTMAGLRVLPKTQGSAFGRSRDVMMISDQRSKPRVLTVMGGKLTTYRASAWQVMQQLYPSLPAPRRGMDTRQIALHPVD
ncbi:glycerol-3-phosphate dehydrogenase/oxidase [Gilvimarinus sp. DA14]|uniref:glycerol-3-phosphate dehydrogenase/oxidase n=1 Tax=Gilvimarinus sp. DA14 TaxID=2956798 RepID=UPI0020B86657|nr:FAD-dependent oxidoreductase [Gilvimarinus sp. DA14]UTF61492.1 FAD-dependent oxidoreductase [Gilvimarinus sp. DA14]